MASGSNKPAWVESKNAMAHRIAMKIKSFRTWVFTLPTKVSNSVSMIGHTDPINDIGILYFSHWRSIYFFQSNNITKEICELKTNRIIINDPTLVLVIIVRDWPKENNFANAPLKQNPFVMVIQWHNWLDTIQWLNNPWNMIVRHSYNILLDWTIEMMIYITWSYHCRLNEWYHIIKFNPFLIGQSLNVCINQWHQWWQLIWYKRNIYIHWVTK